MDVRGGLSRSPLLLAVMAHSAYLQDGALAEDEPVDDLAVRVLIWILISAILLILLVAIATVAKSLLGLLAGATTLLAVVALGGAGYLGLRVMRLEERVRALERIQGR